MLVLVGLYRKVQLLAFARTKSSHDANYYNMADGACIHDARFDSRGHGALCRADQGVSRFETEPESAGTGSSGEPPPNQFANMRI